MRWLFESITSILLFVITWVLDLLGNGVIEMLSMDIGVTSGGNQSVFDAVFTSVFNFTGYFQWFAMGILMVNFIWQLVKITVSRDGASETPLALTARTFAAGIGIFASTQLIQIAEYFFSVLYKQILGTQRLSFALAVPDVSIFGAVDSLIGMIISLAFAIIIGWEFIMFLAEVVERYIILGVLYYTSPLAFSMAGSKSTSSIFNSWLRMLFSQMLLMCFNVFFYRLFTRGYSAYGTAIAGMAAAAGIDPNDIVDVRAGLVIVWNLMMYAILHVGTRIDSYMATLGLSTAQAGRGLATAITSSFSSAVRAIGTASYVAGKATSPVRKAIENRVSGYRDTHKAPEMDKKTGTYTADTIFRVATGKSEEKSLSGKAVGGCFTQANSDFKDVVAKMRLDMNTAKVDSDGQRVTMSSRPDANGHTFGASFVPVTDENRETLQKQQAKFGKVDGVEFAMLIDGTQNDRAQALAGGPEIEKANADWEKQKPGRSVEPIRDEHGDLTGGYHFEEKDKKGEVINSFDIQPESMADPGTMAPGARLIQWGGQDCYKIDTTPRDTGGDKLQNPVYQSDGERMATALNTEFSNASVVVGPERIGQDGTVLDRPRPGGGSLQARHANVGDNGIIEATKQDGTRVGLAPAAEYRLAEGVEGATIRQAANGASYVEVPLGGWEDGTPISASEAFIPVAKDATGAATSSITPPAMDMKGEEVAQHLQKQMSTPLEASSATYDAGSGMFTTTTPEKKDAAGEMTPAQTYAYASAHQYMPVDTKREGVSTVTANSGETFYKVPMQEGETASQVFQPVSTTPARMEMPAVGHVSPIDTMSVARQNFQNQIPEQMTHCEAYSTGAMQMWNAQTEEGQYVLPVSAYTTTKPHSFYTATSGAAYIVIPASREVPLESVATERHKDAGGHYLTAEFKEVPITPQKMPSTGSNQILNAASRKRNKKKSGN